jgi:hypothetical protein
MELRADSRLGSRKVSLGKRKRKTSWCWSRILGSEQSSRYPMEQVGMGEEIRD